MKSLNIVLDFDGTVTAAPLEFLGFVNIMRSCGHRVYIITMRYASEEGEIAQWREYVDGVIFTSRGAKAPAVEQAGIPIHIWIDDTPKAVHMSAIEIWGGGLPEGVTHAPVHDAEVDKAEIAKLLQLSES